ncbi:nucleolar protein 58-like [Diabrotica virgifera virgifera]|uniref:Uncharacterized protein n=1 Tax=Diabrotica virgifera virgifera TaxID=50390 RepID=A0ABM5KFW8_DIAVI|nr:nucleolar protein 58-like [Diabrotica virgifera virgifera]
MTIYDSQFTIRANWSVTCFLFRELQSEDNDSYSTVDQQQPQNKERREKDEGEFKLPRQGRKKKEKVEKKTEEKSKVEKTEKDNPKEENMEEEVPDEADRGTTKRARVIYAASDDKKKAQQKRKP